MSPSPSSGVETRHPILCECGEGYCDGGHVICSACGDDWEDCICGAPDDEDVPWMLADLGLRS